VSPGDSLATARKAAALYFRERGYVADAAYIESGKSDESPEVRIALALLRILAPPQKLPPTKRHGRRIVGEEC
jgi:hypothetical protein